MFFSNVSDMVIMVQKCTICDKTFDKDEDFIRHKQLHQQEKYEMQSESMKELVEEETGAGERTRI